MKRSGVLISEAGRALGKMKFELNGLATGPLLAILCLIHCLAILVLNHTDISPKLKLQSRKFNYTGY
jgi:hypothetical protein